MRPDRIRKNRNPSRTRTRKKSTMHPARRMTRIILTTLTTLLLAACGSDNPPAPTAESAREASGIAAEQTESVRADRTTNPPSGAATGLQLLTSKHDGVAPERDPSSAEPSLVTPRGQIAATRASGQVQYRLPGPATATEESWARMNGPIHLIEGTVIRTGDKSGVVLELPRLGQQIRVSENAVIELSALKNTIGDGDAITDTQVDLRQGEIFCSVPAMKPGSKFAISYMDGGVGIAGISGDLHFRVRSDGTLNLGPGAGNMVLIHGTHSGSPSAHEIKPGQSFDPDTRQVTTTPSAAATALRAEYESLNPEAP